LSNSTLLSRIDNVSEAEPEFLGEDRPIIFGANPVLIESGFALVLFV
jgi:hypothetical protein